MAIFLYTGISLYSFSLKRIGDDVLKQLGISKVVADNKITHSILGGYLDVYGVKNVKNIALSNRTAITNALLSYTKTYVQSAAFKKEYETLRQNQKPTLEKPKTPEEVKRENIAVIKKMITDSEAAIKNADATMKPIFEKTLAEGQKQLAIAEDPNNKQHLRYEKNYPQLLKDVEARNDLMIKNWEAKYPANPQLFVKKRLEEFLLATKDVDYDAQLTSKNGKKIFVNADYERKDSRWKMAYRAGKEVVEPARAFVQQWVAAIN
jgi:hypothetical protein